MSEVHGSGDITPPSTLVLPDGNRRWALEHDVPYAEAYTLGARRIVECSQHLGKLGLRDTWFGIARTFNFERAASEIRAVLDACLEIQGIGQADGEPFNVTVGGNLCLMPPDYLSEFRDQESDVDPDGVTAHLLIGWSSDTEAASFARRAQDHPGEPVEEQLLHSSAVTEPIDFVVRTGVTGQGGRLSGMIPLHSLAAELHFEPTLFPDFTSEHMDAALADYASRGHRNLISL